jgi:hypothetical protein
MAEVRQVCADCGNKVATGCACEACGCELSKEEDASNDAMMGHYETPPGAPASPPTLGTAKAAPTPARHAAAPLHVKPGFGEWVVGLLAIAASSVIGLIIGFVARWISAALLYVFRFISNFGSAWEDSALWVDKTSVWLGIIVCLGVFAFGCIMYFSHLIEENGYKTEKSPIFFYVLPGMAGVVLVALVLSQYIPVWRAVEADEASYQTKLTEARKLEAQGKFLSPPGANAMDCYRAILKEWPRGRGAHEGIERVWSVYSDRAAQLAGSRRFVDAEAVYQAMLVAGCSENQVNRLRSTQYRMVAIAPNGKWSDPIDIGEDHAEIVSSGPFEVSDIDQRDIRIIKSDGTRESKVGHQSVCFRLSGSSQPLVLYVPPSSGHAPAINPFGLFSNRKPRNAPIKVTIRSTLNGQIQRNEADPLAGGGHVSLSLPRAQPLSPPKALPLDTETERVGDWLVRYRTRISANDHYTSKGKLLDSIKDIKLQDILQQDRFNYWKGKNRDRDDQADAIGYSALVPHFIKPLADQASHSCMNDVMNGSPLLEVIIYPANIQVRLLAR